MGNYIRTHRLVKQLLKLLVGVIDAQLFKAVHLEDFEASNIEDTDEAGTLSLCSVQRPEIQVISQLDASCNQQMNEGELVICPHILFQIYIACWLYLIPG